MDREKYYNLFRQETFERIKKVEDLLLKISEGDIDENILSNIKREMHTIKGSARIIGFKNISDIAHIFEDIFKDSDKITQIPLKNLINTTLKSLTIIKKLTQERDVVSTSISEEIEELKKDVNKLLDIKTNEVKKDTGNEININLREKIKKSLKKDEKSPTDISHVKKDVEKNLIEELPDVFKISAIDIEEILKSATNLKVLQNRLEYIPENFIFYTKSLKKIYNKLLPSFDPKFLIEFRDLINLLEEEKDEIFKTVENHQKAFNHLWDKITDLRLIPLSVILDIYPSYIKRFSIECGKKIDLKIIGSQCKVDKRVVEKLNEALIHIIRNSISHGIESPDERKRLGKLEKGNIEIKITENRGIITIKISDDGRGIDTDKIRETAVKKGFFTEAEMDRKSEEETLSIIYKKGFSTAEKTDEISGRGIGMDVVKQRIEEIGGKLAIETNKNSGTTIIIEIPISISTHKILVIKWKDYFLGFLEENVKTVEIFEKDNVRGEKENFYLFDGELIPFFKLNTDMEKGEVIIFSDINKKIAILIDAVLDREEVIIKKSDFLNEFREFSGFGINHKSTIIPILNPFLIKGKITIPEKSDIEVKKVKRILLVEDSAITRELEKNILRKNGFEVIEAENGLDAFEKLDEENIDLIISDIDMPIMDGFTFVEKIKQREEFSKIPVIIVTMKESNEDKLRAIKLGVDGYITKESFNGMKLLRIINRLI